MLVSFLGIISFTDMITYGTMNTAFVARHLYAYKTSYCIKFLE